MGLKEEVSSYNNLVSRAVVALDRDLSITAERVVAIRKLVRVHQDELPQVVNSVTNLSRQMEMTQSVIEDQKAILKALERNVANTESDVAAVSGLPLNNSLTRLPLVLSLVACVVSVAAFIMNLL